MFGKDKKTAVAVAEVSAIEKINQDVVEWQAAMEKIAAREPGLKFLAMYRLMSLEAQAIDRQKAQGCDAEICDAEKEKRVTACNKLRNAMRALKEGFEPCLPPSEWYAGLVNTGMDHDDARRAMGWRNFNPFPSKNASKVKTGAKGYRDELGNTWTSIYYFTGLIPPEVVAKCTQALEIFGWPNIHVYSPREKDIQATTVPNTDPMMIGRIEDIPGFGILYFRIATWGLSDDLKSLFGEESH